MASFISVIIAVLGRETRQLKLCLYIHTQTRAPAPVLNYYQFG